MGAGRDQVLKHYRQMREEMLGVLEGLSDAAMVETSLDGWSIKDHLAHIAHWDDIRTGEVVRISAGHDSAWRMSGELDEAFNAISYDLRSALPLEQVTWEWTVSRQRLLDAISAATPRGLDPSLYGEAGLVSSHERQHAEWVKRWRGERGL